MTVVLPTLFVTVTLQEAPRLNPVMANVSYMLPLVCCLNMLSKVREIEFLTCWSKFSAADSATIHLLID